MIRTFIAVNLASAVVEEIAKIQAKLKEAANDIRTTRNIRWARVEGMHLTLKFLGDIDQSQVAPILDRLHSALQDQRVFQVTAQGLGGFPNLKRPRVIWAGLKGDELTTLSKGVQAALLPLGFPSEKRNFTPHMTLGRVRSQQEWDQVLPHVRQYEHTHFGESSIDQVTLYQSDLQPSGAIYTPLGSIPLQHHV